MKKAKTKAKVKGKVKASRKRSAVKDLGARKAGAVKGGAVSATKPTGGGELVPAV